MFLVGWRTFRPNALQQPIGSLSLLTLDCPIKPLNPLPYIGCMLLQLVEKCRVEEVTKGGETKNTNSNCVKLSNVLVSMLLHRWLHRCSSRPAPYIRPWFGSITPADLFLWSSVQFWFKGHFKALERSGVIVFVWSRCFWVSCFSLLVSSESIQAGLLFCTRHNNKEKSVMSVKFREMHRSSVLHSHLEASRWPFCCHHAWTF